MFCCICSATARRDSSNPSNNNLQLFKRPKSVEKYSTNSSPFVCSQHFASKYMREEEEEVWLRADAIPTLGLPLISSYNNNQQPKSQISINTHSSRNNLEISSQLVNNLTTSSLKSASPLPRISEDPNEYGTLTPGDAKGVETTNGRCSPNKLLSVPTRQTNKTDDGLKQLTSVPKTPHQWATHLRPEFDDICGEPIWSFATNRDLEMFVSLSIGQQNQILVSILSEEPEMNQELIEPSLPNNIIKPADLPGSTNNEMEESMIEERARLQRLDRSRPTQKSFRQSRKNLMAQLKIKDDQIVHLKKQVRRLKKQIASSGSSFKEEENDVRMDNGARPSVLRLSHYIPVIPAAVKLCSNGIKHPPEEIIIIE